MTIATSCEKMSKSGILAGIPPESSLLAYSTKRLMRAMTMSLTLTEGSSSLQALRKRFSVTRWNSSGNT